MSRAKDYSTKLRPCLACGTAHALGNEVCLACNISSALGASNVHLRLAMRYYNRLAEFSAADALDYHYANSRFLTTESLDEVQSNSIKGCGDIRDTVLTARATVRLGIHQSVKNLLVVPGKGPNITARTALAQATSDLFTRQKAACAICREPLTTENTALDTFWQIPWAHSRFNDDVTRWFKVTTITSGLAVLLCAACNGAKSNADVSGVGVWRWMKAKEYVLDYRHPYDGRDRSAMCPSPFPAPPRPGAAQGTPEENVQLLTAGLWAQVLRINKFCTHHRQRMRVGYNPKLLTLYFGCDGCVSDEHWIASYVTCRYPSSRRNEIQNTKNK
jgi:hypothetical protein